MPTAAAVRTAGEKDCFVIPDGTLEALKWLGLASMTVDHVNKYLLHDSVSAFFAMGRLALPIFAFVLSYKLARPSTLANARAVFPRVLKRLVAGALLASPPFMALGGLAGGWWPLNILAAFAVAVAAMYAVHCGGAWGRAMATGLVTIGGGLVEYWWPGIAMCLAAWYYCRRPSQPALALWVLAILALNLDGWAFGALPPLNASMWAMTAFPLMFGAARVNIRMLRLKWVFYAYYPMHLAILWLLSTG
jgi:hypothetical protein